jgi:hypothetical protein
VLAADVLDAGQRQGLALRLAYEQNMTLLALAE